VCEWAQKNAYRRGMCCETRLSLTVRRFCNSQCTHSILHFAPCTRRIHTQVMDFAVGLFSSRATNSLWNYRYCSWFAAHSASCLYTWCCLCEVPIRFGAWANSAIKTLGELFCVGAGMLLCAVERTCMHVRSLSTTLVHYACSSEGKLFWSGAHFLKITTN